MTDQLVKKEKNRKIFIPFIILAFFITGGIIYWYIDYSKYIKTDDAHVESDNVAVSSKILGRISQEFVQEGDSVREGQLVALLDSTDLIAQKNQALANQKQAETAVIQAQAKFQYELKNDKVLEINLDKAQEDFARAQAQYQGSVIPLEQFQHAQKALESAKAQLEAAQSESRVSEAQIKSSQSAVASAEAQIKVIQSQINNTRLFSPANGIVGKRWLLPGDISQPGQSIFTIINDKNRWVSVFLEENKIENLHLGQQVLFTLDTYPGVTFTGKIINLGSNTASQFSLIPANNASGNFTKVTQRVQLKVSIAGTKDGKDISSYRILSGMSAVVKIIKS
jgi:membrane fusion protein (multidrug efflux system)